MGAQQLPLDAEGGVGLRVVGRHDLEVSAAVGANIAFVVGACFASCAFGTCRKSLAGNGLFDDLRERKAPPIPCLRALIIFVVAVVVFSMVVVTVVVVVVVSMARMTTT